MRKDLTEWIRDYCRKDFYGDAVVWKHDEDYEIGDIVVGDDRHTYKALTAHTSNNNPPPDNVTDWEYTEETLPAGIKIALTRIEEYMSVNMAVQSESLGDYSVTYSLATNFDKLPPPIRSLLTPYRSIF